MIFYGLLFTVQVDDSGLLYCFASFFPRLRLLRFVLLQLRLCAIYASHFELCVLCVHYGSGFLWVVSSLGSVFYRIVTSFMVHIFYGSALLVLSGFLLSWVSFWACVFYWVVTPIVVAFYGRHRLWFTFSMVCVRHNVFIFAYLHAYFHSFGFPSTIFLIYGWHLQRLNFVWLVSYTVCFFCSSWVFYRLHLLQLRFFSPSPSG